MKALILAGGSGTRLWPFSLQKKPKQLLSILGETSLMAQTLARLAPVVDERDIWIVTNKECAADIVDHCPNVPEAQIIPEPFPLGTSLAVGLGLIQISRSDPDAIVIVGWADSYIGNERKFHEAVRAAELLIDEADGVILSVPPTHAATGYGYVEAGEPLEGHENCYQIR